MRIVRRIETLFGYGFRIFFASTALYAVVLMLLWLGALRFGWPVAGTNPIAWHAHEMLFGVVAAAIAGFLLTAAPNWTATDRAHGRALALLWALWLAGRLGYVLLDPYADSNIALIVRLVDLAFLPGVALAIAAPIIETGNRRNRVMIVLLGVLFIANLAHAIPEFNATASRLTIDLVMLMMALVGGRITPAFTRNWLKLRGHDGALVVSRPGLDMAALGLLVLVAALGQFVPASPVTAAVAALAATLHLIRLLGWRGWRTLSDPLVWVLHLGYLWIALALIARAAGIMLDSVATNAWYHAAGAGAMATLILGVMARVSLGHTGRPLRLPAGGVWMFVLITIAAIARVGAALGMLPYSSALWVAGTLWIAAFGLFLILYLPILAAPRADGRTG